MVNFNNDINFMIALYTPYYGLSNLCRVNRSFRNIYYNSYFWKEKIRIDFGILVPKVSNLASTITEDCHNMYILILHRCLVEESTDLQILFPRKTPNRCKLYTSNLNYLLQEETSKGRKLEVIRILNMGTDPKYALYGAIEGKFFLILQYLLKNYKFSSSDLENSMVLSAKEGKIDAIKYLVNIHGEFTSQYIFDRIINDALGSAVINNHFDTVKFIMETFNISQEIIDVTLANSSYYNNLPIFEYILKYNSGKEGIYQSWISASKSNYSPDIIKYMISNNIAMDFYSEGLINIIFLAKHSKDSEMLKLLLENHHKFGLTINLMKSIIDRERNDETI